jgi:hypothetical protein
MSKELALAAIADLEISDCLNFFYAKADERAKEIADMVDTGDGLEVDGAITSEGDDNGSWVLAWTWVPFDGTDLDKEKESEEVDA